MLLQQVSEITFEQDTFCEFNEVCTFTDGNVGVIWDTYEKANKVWKCRRFISTYTMLMHARYKYDDIVCRESCIQAVW